MSETDPPRRPAAFRVDELARRNPSLAVPTAAEAEPARTPRALPDLARLSVEPDDAIEAEDAGLQPLPKPRRRFPFAGLFFGALGALVSIAIGFAIDGLVRDLFTRADWLGWTALGFALLLALAAFGILVRETAGLMRLAAVDRERKAALKAFETDSETDARQVVAGLVALLADKPGTTEGRARLAAARDDVIDGRDQIILAERELLVPLDVLGRALVLASAKRVSVVTAVSPKAIVDVGFVLFESVRLIRLVAELYGARPGTIGLIKLTRDVVGHLAVTGTIAIGDDVIGQVVGHGLAARLSTRLGEGVVNGLLTARIGLAAMDLCRPMPFIAARRPKIGDFMSDLTALRSDARKPQSPAR